MKHNNLKPIKIGIFGGCFNPPHLMHKSIALDLIKKKYLDKVIFVPSGDDYAKNNLISCIDRIKMLNLMLENNPKVEVSDLELKRGSSYTYQVLDYFKKQNPDSQLYFICGSDNLNQFDCWKNFEYVMTNYQLLVINRNNDNISELNHKYVKYQANINFVDINFKDLSSTEIRNLINQKNRDDLLEKIDLKVLDYINNKNLYN